MIGAFSIHVFPMVRDWARIVSLGNLCSLLSCHVRKDAATIARLLGVLQDTSRIRD